MSAFHCWNWAVYETTPYLVTHPSTRSHIHKHTHGCKCVFWRWKSCLYSFVVSGLRINQITAMAAASPPPHLLTPAPLTAPPPSPARGYWPSRGPGSAGGGPRSVSRLQMLLSIGLCVPQTSPMPGDQTHYCRSDIKTNREEWKPLNAPCSQSHVRIMSKHNSIMPSVAVDTQKCIVYVTIMQIWPSLMSRHWNLFTVAQLIWIASRPATVCRH